MAAFPIMSTETVTADPAKLRPLLHQKLDALTDGDLAAVHDLLQEFERRALFAQMADDTEAERQAGKLEPHLIDAAIRAHRARHPYR